MKASMVGASLMGRYRSLGIVTCKQELAKKNNPNSNAKAADRDAWT